MSHFYKIGTTQDDATNESCVFISNLRGRAPSPRGVMGPHND
jgi:hypothetical protein